ncbi:MAG: YbjN domain-containing protein [Cyanobacteria bacterium P01_A01_bin.45]
MVSNQAQMEPTNPDSAIDNEILNNSIDTSKIDHVEVIENVISTLDEEEGAMVKRSEDGSQLWKFKYGSVEVFVQLTGISNEDTITIWSPVLKLPGKDEPKMMRQLLEMNSSSTFEARFGIINDQVVVISSRILEDLSPSEVSRLITIVATIADDNDEALMSEFGMVHS